MIDHLLIFQTEAEACTALPAYYTPASDDGPGSWRGDCCFPGLSVYKVTGTEEVTDPMTGQTYTREIHEDTPGWHIWITRPQLDEGLRDLPGNACRIIADYEMWKAGDPGFIRYVAPDLDRGTLADWTISPTPAREKQYPFGNPPAVQG